MHKIEIDLNDYPLPKHKIRKVTLNLDVDVIEWFRGLGPLYQRKMRAVLRQVMLNAQRKSDAQETESETQRPEEPRQ